MQRRRLGKSGLMVSEIGLGTMTFGTQCSTKEESFQIMSQAVDSGINFFDTAEIYPVPPKTPLAGITEVWIGEWMKSRPREEVLIASKIAGPAHGWFNPPVRSNNAAIDRVHLRKALEGSLRRLQTDYIDLYQVHWPDHGMRMEDTIETLHEFVKEGKVRTIGCSNENSYGLMKGLWTSDKHNWSRFDTIQNNFSLNNRRFLDELAEICLREDVSLLPYSPLAGGVLSGKYNAPHMPTNARFYEYLKKGEARQKAMVERFINKESLALTGKLLKIAQEHELHPLTLATAWSKQHKFVASTLIGVSHISQLPPILAASHLTLNDEIMAQINTACLQHPYPMG